MTDLFAFIKRFYNHIRLHSAPAFSPEQFERLNAPPSPVFQTRARSLRYCVMGIGLASHGKC